MWKDNLKKYDALIALTPEIERKGKTMPYTSANGYMFSLLNKDGELGIRLPKASQAAFREMFNSGEFRSHNAVIRDYVLVPSDLLDDPKLLSTYIRESHDFVMSLKPKPGKKSD